MTEEMWDNIEKLSELRSKYSCLDEEEKPYYHALSLGIEGIKALEQEPRWIHVSERLPDSCEAVNITWVNHNPESYYASIVDKPFTATGCYCEGEWYWYSSVCEDLLSEYGHNDVDLIDAGVEVIAWMPLPEPYRRDKE